MTVTLGILKVSVESLRELGTQNLHRCSLLLLAASLLPSDDRHSSSMPSPLVVTLHSSIIVIIVIDMRSYKQTCKSTVRCSFAVVDLGDVSRLEEKRHDAV